MLQQTFLGMYPEKTNSKRYMHPNAHSSTIYNSQDMEATSLSISTEEWIKMWNIHAMEYSHKKWNNAISSNMDWPRDYNTKWSQRKTNIMFPSTYIWNLENTYELIYKNRLKDIKKIHLWLPKGNGGRDKLGVWN